MQRDFLEANGFGAALGNDVTQLTRAIEPCSAVLAAARAAKMLIIHTREGHRPDMADVHSHKNRKRGLDGEIVSDGPIGEEGKLGRTLIRGEPGHDIIPKLYPKDGEPVIDKPGKGSVSTCMCVQCNQSVCVCVLSFLPIILTCFLWLMHIIHKSTSL